MEITSAQPTTTIATEFADDYEAVGGWTVGVRPYAAIITDTDRQYGFAREFVRATRRASPSGASGTLTYDVRDEAAGTIVELSGKKGRSMWVRTSDGITKIDEAQARDLLAGRARVA